MKLSELIVLSSTFFLPFLTTAQETTTNLKERPTATAISITDKPLLDGEVLNDDLWQKIKPFGSLSQIQPNFGQPASERTDIRIAYTASTFYVSVVCYDSQPNKLVVSDARRDADLENTDAFIFILDTYKDNQMALFLEPIP